MYKYEPKYFDFGTLVSDFSIDEDNFTLMNAQHIIAKLGGFTKWTEMSKASPSRLELSKLLYDNMDRVSVRDWQDYILGVETGNKTIDDEFRLEIFIRIFLEGEQDIYYEDYRLLPSEEPIIEKKQIDRLESKPIAKISSLPLNKDDRKEFITAADNAFERIIEHIEPEHPELTRSLWDAEHFIDKELLSSDMLPIDRDYALSLVDSFLVQYVIGLAVKADDQAVHLN
ncbi:hypothetical protein [Pedobacter sp. N23S346]|uniref:hypothetical protein n=1 Tax=Pedobacter sp. N23S346 TaxID=3402750 RepID=UPI003ABF8748